jgi:selenocysteine lyase/cysteine desulfurase
VALARIARERGGLSLLDASQTVGIVPLPRGASVPDVVVAAGHKWLQGPEGGAMLFAREGIEPRPLVQGGTGSASDDLRMPQRLVDRLEAGTPDLAALAGLSAGVAWVERQGIAALAAHGHRLASACRAALAPLPGVRLLGRGGGKGPPIVGFTVEGYDPAEVATLLEQIAGVQARAGLHCAGLIHRHLGAARGGSVRLGFGPFNTPDDVRAVVAAVAAIVGLPDNAPSDPFPSPTQVPPWQE